MNILLAIFVNECSLGLIFPGDYCNPFLYLNKCGKIYLLDFIEGLPRSADKDCIMVVIDRLSKVEHFVPLAHPYTATQVAQVILEYSL